MKNDAINAYRLMCEKSYTCVLCKGNVYFCSKERGVKPLLEHIEEAVSFAGFSAADKIVGRAAAFLYVLMNVDEVHAQVMSRAARETLAQYNIKSACDAEVETIYNRANTGICPMEEAVRDASSPQDAYKKIREKLLLMQRQREKAGNVC